MTTVTQPLTARRSPVLLRVALVVAVLLAVVDLIGAILYWPYAPLAINVAYIVISALTVVGAIVAWRGAAWGAWLVIVTRFLSIVMSLPVFLDTGAPAEAIAPSAIQDVVTIAAIIAVLVGLSRARRAA